MNKKKRLIPKKNALDTAFIRSDTVLIKLLEFRDEFARKFGVDNAIVKLAITPEAMCALAPALVESCKYSLTHSEWVKHGYGDINFMGIQIVVRRRDEF